MVQKLDAITNVEKAAVPAQTFDHYRITNFHFQQGYPDGPGQLTITIVPCREENGKCFFDPKNSQVIPITNPLAEAAANPSGAVQLVLDAMVNLAADKNSLVNAATV